MFFLPASLQQKLKNIEDKHLLRSLKPNYPKIDFSSNDYLGFSTQGILSRQLKRISLPVKSGATGSRLISGNSSLFEEIEYEIAECHHSESALLYNSGYNANLGLLSCIPQKGDLVISDELIHASLIDGIRLSFATHYKFKHNDITDLLDLLSRQREKFKEAYLVVESVYSMDGDSAPLLELVNICQQYNVYLIVDEAHALGVFGKQGRGLCQELNVENDCFARVYTFGKALGCHGAAVVGSNELKQYLINFSRSFIYTTAMPEHGLLAIKVAYQLLQTTTEIETLQKNIQYFKTKIQKETTFIASHSAIHCQLVRGNEAVQALEDKLSCADVFAKAIKSPTVKKSQERIRICLHSFNTKDDIDLLFELLSA